VVDRHCANELGEHQTGVADAFGDDPHGKGGHVFHGSQNQGWIDFDGANGKHFSRILGGESKPRVVYEVSFFTNPIYNACMRSIFVLGGLCLSLSAFAVAPGSASDTNTTDFTFVGTVNGASGVLVGNDMVLTAKHVGAGTFTMPGIGSYSVVGGSVVSDPNSDLTLFRIDVGAATLAHATVDIGPMNFGDAITMVGFGGSGVLNAAMSGYDITIGAGTRRKANAIYEFTEYVSEPGFLAGFSLISPLRQNGQGALVGGDSGGGWFKNGRLVGTNSFIGTWGNGNNFLFSNSQTDFFASGAISLSDHADFLRSNNVVVVPEPATFAVLGLGLAALIRRRRK
jgi:PEP-CTERM motif